MLYADSSEMSGYTGYLYAVQATIYNEREPEYEDGIFREWMFDDVEEAREMFDAQVMQEAEYQLLLDEERDPYFDSLAIMLTVRYFENGRDMDYDTAFSEMVLEKSTLHRS